MNKRLLVGLFSAFMAMVPWCGYAAETGQTVDAPHVNVDSDGTTEDCTYCHFADYQPSDCDRCHHTNPGPYADGTAPAATTHQSLKCQACHNPHVSLQAETTITGGFTFTPATVGPPADAGDTANCTVPVPVGTTCTSTLHLTNNQTPEASWEAKTGETGRGMILWVNDTWLDADNLPVNGKASFEIKSIDTTAKTVTVKGDMSAIDGRTFDLRRGQLIAKKVSKVPLPETDLTTQGTYRQETGTLPAGVDEKVQFPATGIPLTSGAGDNPFVQADGKGICQVCHTATNYWSNGGSQTHNNGKECTGCHKHASGFMVTGCTACHPGPDDQGPPTTAAQLANPLTGSATAGAHAKHAAIKNSTDSYNFACSVCHFGTGMYIFNNQETSIYGDGIQIGFQVTKSGGEWLGLGTSYNGQAAVTVPYVGTNYTNVTKTGVAGSQIPSEKLTCSNVYCHSNGKAATGRLNCKTSTTNTSVAWDWDGTATGDPQSDNEKCNNCHGFWHNTGALNKIISIAHTKHLTMNLINGYTQTPCLACHASTTENDGTGKMKISNKSMHVNGSVEVVAGGYRAGTNPLKPIAFTYVPGPTPTCSFASGADAVSCHNGETKNWLVSLNPETETCIPTATLCVGDAMVNLDPIMAWQTQNIDNNTVLLTDVSVDPDRVDPVKNFCQGGGFSGGNGVLKVQAANDSKLGNLAPAAYLNGTGQPSAPVVHTFRSIGIAPVNGTTQVLDLADPAQPKAWWFYVVADNGPLSKGLINRTSDVPNDGIVRSGWFAHVMTLVDMPITNANPVLDFDLPTVANGGLVRSGNNVTLTINNKTIDTDSVDANKNTLFGGGHNGSIGRQRVWLLNAATDAVTPANGDSSYLGVVYDNTNPVNSPISLVVKGATGYKVWYQVAVRDNHYVSINADKEKKSFTISSGWMSATLP